MEIQHLQVSLTQSLNQISFNSFLEFFISSYIYEVEDSL